jgi:hypothetical protein
MDARMDNVRLKIQIDFGVRDVMVPATDRVPALLDSESIRLRADLSSLPSRRSKEMYPRSCGSYVANNGKALEDPPTGLQKAKP